MDRVQTIIAAQRDRFLAEFREFLAFRSIKGDAAGLAGAAEWTAARLRQIGAQVQTWATDGTPPVVFAEIIAPSESCICGAWTLITPPLPDEPNDCENKPAPGLDREMRLPAVTEMFPPCSVPEVSA